MRLFALTVISLWPAAAADPGITPREKLWIASKIYAAIESRFGHWQAIPGFDLDQAYQHYLDRIAATDSRRDFDLATMEFIAQLRNGHTTFSDRWLGATSQLPGFYCRLQDGQWVVYRSGRPGLEVGEVVVSIDGHATGDFVAERAKYIPSSSERARQTMAFFFTPLWPREFDVTLAGGRKIHIDRAIEPVATGASRIWVFAPRGQPPADVPYLPIPSFGDPRQEQNAVAFLQAHKDAPAVVIDLRGNGGGSTPDKLIRAIMDRPWPGWLESTSVLFPLFRTYGERYSPRNAAADPRGEGYLEGFAEYFGHPYLMLPEPMHPPENPIYTGRVILIADSTCGSACEDFVMPLKYSHRATVVGETTGGSSGQPYMYDFGNGMSFRVGTKRMYFPDGTEFEGVGIRPDIEVAPDAADLKSGRDPLLEKAVALARPR